MNSVFSGPSIVVEVGQAHDGDLSLLLDMVERTATVGADAIKFQLHLPDEESSLEEPFRDSSLFLDSTRYEYWKRTSFSMENWALVVERAIGAGLQPIFSTFSILGLTRIQELGLRTIKIGSAEALWPGFLRSAASISDQLIVSTGMSTWDDVDSAVRLLAGFPCELALLQCTSLYPTPVDQVGLTVISEMKARYGTTVGLSDHSGNVRIPIIALARGADIVEVHVSPSENSSSPDHSSSLNYAELALLCEVRDDLLAVDSSNYGKEELTDSQKRMKSMFGRSVCTRNAIAAGEPIERDNLAMMKPAGGLGEHQISAVVGRRARHDLPSRHQIRWEDLA